MVFNIVEWLVEKTALFPKWLQIYIVLIAYVGLFALIPVLIALPIWVIFHGNIVLGIILAIFVSGPLMTVLLTGEESDVWY
ncbi:MULTISPECIES: hypothetical protein [Lactobacillaceae]|uniref:hypothetical protein n=1 Tax=Lactobacillaceae TaxID=33958 RepID=UPI001E64E873|nr:MULTISPECIES: hypothetical protein [Lactobacillaceae]MCC4508527.1 hypothetical protein [Limosilactobacillus reuteri]